MLNVLCLLLFGGCVGWSVKCAPIHCRRSRGTWTAWNSLRRRGSSRRSSENRLYSRYARWPERTPAYTPAVLAQPSARLRPAPRSSSQVGWTAPRGGCKVTVRRKNVYWRRRRRRRRCFMDQGPWPCSSSLLRCSRCFAQAKINRLMMFLTNIGLLVTSQHCNAPMFLV